MNYFELDGASNNSVDNIRDLVDQVRFVPQTGKYKVYVIDEVHMLSSSAFNAFLKTLEEPPPYAIFILATTEKHKILPTILSRCQIFDFKRITIQDTVDHLKSIARKENVQTDEAGLQLIAQKSEGCMRDALSILDKIVSFTGGNVTYTTTLDHLNILDADYYFKLIDCMLNQDLAGAMLLYDDIDKKGFEGDLVLNGLKPADGLPKGAPRRGVVAGHRCADFGAARLCGRHDYGRAIKDIPSNAVGAGRVERPPLGAFEDQIRHAEAVVEGVHNSPRDATGGEIHQHQDGTPGSGREHDGDISVDATQHAPLEPIDGLAFAPDLRIWRNRVCVLGECDAADLLPRGQPRQML